MQKVQEGSKEIVSVKGVEKILSTEDSEKAISAEAEWKKGTRETRNLMREND